MLVLHVSSPVVFPREGLAALPGVGAVLLGAVVLPGLVVLVVDVAIQVRLCTKLHATARVGALVGSLVVPLMMAGTRGLAWLKDR